MAIKKTKKSKSPTLRTIKVTKYKGFNILIQMVVDINMFQCILFKDGQFYQAHDFISPASGQKEHTIEDILKCGMLMLDTSFQIADQIELAEIQDRNKKLAKGGVRAD